MERSRSLVRQARTLTCRGNGRTLSVKEPAMTTQSVDTHPHAERIMIDVIRQAPMSKRFRLVQSLTQCALWSSLQASQERHREASEQEAAVGSVSCSYGPALGERVPAALGMRERWHIQPAYLVTFMLPALGIFDALSAPFSLAASVPSSLPGLQHVAQ